MEQIGANNKKRNLLLPMSIITYIDTNIIYPVIRRNPSSIYSFCLLLVIFHITIQRKGRIK